MSLDPLVLARLQGAIELNATHVSVNRQDLAALLASQEILKKDLHVEKGRAERAISFQDDAYKNGYAEPSCEGRRDEHMNDQHGPAHAALQFANTVRKRIGLKPAVELSKGDREEPRSCPISNTVRQGVALYVSTDEYSCTVYWKDEEAQHVETPLEVANFITAFDGGHFPEYEDKG